MRGDRHVTMPHAARILCAVFTVLLLVVKGRGEKVLRRPGPRGHGLPSIVLGPTCATGDVRLWITPTAPNRKRFSPILVVGIAGAFALCLPVYSQSQEGQVVRSGDEVAVNFTCRLPSGDVAASSYRSVAENAALKKSPVFWRRTVDTPIAITAGIPSSTDARAAERSLEDEILYRLAPPVVGMQTGETKTVEIAAPPRLDSKKDEYLQKVARVRQRMKEMRVPPDQYTARSGKAPEVGHPFILDPALPGRVASVSEKEVVIKFSAAAGSKVPTPFGEGTVKELPDRYEITIDAHPGDLVRTGAYVGRVTAVDERFIAIDYSLPFGGEPLRCDVLVESVKPAAK